MTEYTKALRDYLDDMFDHIGVYDDDEAPTHAEVDTWRTTTNALLDNLDKNAHAALCRQARGEHARDEQRQMLEIYRHKLENCSCKLPRDRKSRPIKIGSHVWDIECGNEYVVVGVGADNRALCVGPRDGMDGDGIWFRGSELSLDRVAPSTPPLDAASQLCMWANGGQQPGADDLRALAEGLRRWVRDGIESPADDDAADEENDE